MKSYLYLVWTILLVAGFIYSAGAQENLLPNPSFEDGDGPPDEWLWRVPSTNPDNIRWSMSTDANTGSQSVRYDSDATEGYKEGGLIEERVPVVVGEAYTLSMWTKAENATRIRAQIFWQSSGNDYLGRAEDSDLIVEFNGSPLTLSHDWEKQERLEIVVPETSEGEAVAKAAIFIHAQGGGIVWFDDVFFGKEPEPPAVLFPDLNSDNRLDFHDQLPISKRFRPEGLNADDVGFGEIIQLIDESRKRKSFSRGVPFRKYYPLIDGSKYYYRSDDPGNNVDYFTQEISSVTGSRDFKVSIRNTSDGEAEHSAIISGTGDLAIQQMIIEQAVAVDSITIPPQTVDLVPPLIVGLERVDETFEQTTSTAAELDVNTILGLVTVPVTVQLTSRVTSVGDAVSIGESLGTSISKTITVENQIFFLTSGTSGIPTEIFFSPGSGIFWFQRDVGMVQLQEFTDPTTPGEIFPLRTATVGGRTFP